MSRRVCILGASLDTGNMGVSALSVSLIENIVDRIPDGEINLIIPHHEPNERRIVVGGHEIVVKGINWRRSPKSRFDEHILGIFFKALLYRITPFRRIRQKIVNSNPMLKALKGAVLVGDIHGGDSFSDIYGVPRFLTHIIQNLVIILLKQDYVLFPQTYGPYYSRIARHYARRILKHARVIVSRDVQSIGLIKKLLGRKFDESKILMTPDVAFKLHPREPRKIETDDGIIPGKEQKFIGINVSGLLYSGGYNRKNMFGLSFDYKAFMEKLIRQLLESFDRPLLLVPHTYARLGSVEDDRFACLDLKKNLPPGLQSRVTVVTGDYDQSEVKWVIGNCDFFMGSRMHSCIAAISQGIPTVGIAYSKKFLGVFSSIKSDHLVVDATAIEEEEALERIKTLYAGREEDRRRLVGELRLAKEQLTRVFDRLIQS